MTIQRFETGPRMSQVVIHGDTVYLAGVVAHKAAGEGAIEPPRSGRLQFLFRPPPKLRTDWK